MSADTRFQAHHLKEVLAKLCFHLADEPPPTYQRVLHGAVLVQGASRSVKATDPGSPRPSCFNLKTTLRNLCSDSVVDLPDIFLSEFSPGANCW